MFKLGTIQLCIMYVLYLAEYIDQSTIDPASASHDTVTRELRQR